MIEVRDLEVDLLPSNNRNTLLVFTSRNAVRNDILSAYPEALIAVIGEKTAGRVREFGREVSLISSKSEELYLADEILSNYGSLEIDVHLFQGNTASSFVSDKLYAGGVRVSKHLVYEVRKASYSKERLVHFLREGAESKGLHYVTLLSLNTAEIFFKELETLFAKEEMMSVLLNLSFVTLSSKVKDYLEDKGVSMVKFTTDRSAEGIVDAIFA
jgi:uroporphyrinogen-III synthase